MHLIFADSRAKKSLSEDLQILGSITSNPDILDPFLVVLKIEELGGLT